MPLATGENRIGKLSNKELREVVWVRFGGKIIASVQPAMQRKDFLKIIPKFSIMETLNSCKNFSRELYYRITFIPLY
jgi:hypothetical protein